MNCKEVRKYISSLVDHALEDDIEKDMMNHIENCSDCKNIYEEEKLIKETLLSEELEDLPTGFELRLHEKLAETIDKNNGNRKEKSTKIIRFVRKNRKYFAVAAVLVLSVVLVNNLPLGIGGNLSNDMAAPAESVAMDMAVSEESFSGQERNMITFDEESKAVSMEEASEEVYSEPEISNEYQTGRVIIKNGNLTLDILDLDETTQLITEKVSEYDGYISNQYSNVQYVDSSGKEYRNGSIQVKIASEYFDEFMEYAKTLGRLMNSNVNSNDITNQYRDTVSSIDNLEITQERLRDLLKKSATVEETLQIERELTRIRGELDYLEGNIKNWDRLSQYSTISISLNEVEAIEVKIQSIDKNIFQKSKEGLMNTINMISSFLEKSFINLVAYSPIIIIIGILLFIIRKVYKRRIKK